LALPLYLHLKRRPPKDAVAFSSLMFLKPTRAVHIKRRSQFENILLLILRSLAILGLALMFARPFVRNDAVADSEDAMNGRHVILIDTSASMRRPGLWEAALKEARDALPDSSSASAAIFAFDSAPREIVSFEEWSAWAPPQRKERARAALDALEPGWSKTDVGSAVSRGLDAIDEAEAAESTSGLLARHRVTVISDLQKSATVDALREIEWPENTDLFPLLVESGDAGNAGLQWIKAATGNTPDVRITNSEDSESGRFTLKWSDRPESEAATIDVPPGESRVLTPPARESADDTGAELVLTGDKSDFDNRLFFAPAAHRTARILYTGEHDANSARSPFYYLRRGFPVTGEMKPIFLKPGETGADFIIIPALSELASGDVESIRTALDQGTTTLAVLDDGSQATAILGVLSGSSGITVSETPERDYSILARIDFDHPLLAAFDDPKVRDFTKIRFWKSRSLASNSLPKNAIVLATFDNEAPAWIIFPVGRGSLVVLTSGWTPTDSQLARSSKFIPLLYSLCGAGGLANGAAMPTFAGEPLPPIENEANEAVTLTLPDGTKKTLAATDHPIAETPGIHTLTFGQTTERFAVNIPPGESETASLPFSEFEAFGIPVAQSGTPAVTPKGADAEKIRSRERDSEREKQQRMWQWIVLSVILLLILETWLAGRPPKTTGDADPADNLNPEPVPSP
jgi:hypothetical protein